MPLIWDQFLCVEILLVCVVICGYNSRRNSYVVGLAKSVGGGGGSRWWVVGGSGGFRR